MAAAVERAGIPVFALIRPRGGNFVYTRAEISLTSGAERIRWSKRVPISRGRPDGRPPGNHPRLRGPPLGPRFRGSRAVADNWVAGTNPVLLASPLQFDHAAGAGVSEMPADWAAQRVKNLSLGKAIMNAVLPKMRLLNRAVAEENSMRPNS